MMKNLVMIVHANLQQDLADCLREQERVHGFTFSHAEGHGSQLENDALLSARDKVVGYVPRVRVDVLLDDADVDVVITALRATKCGVASRGVYWVTPVEQSGQL